MNPKPTTLTEQFAQLRQQRSVMIGLLFLLVIVVFWIGIGLFSSQQKFAVPKAMRDLAKPLSPIVDESVFASIEQKRAYSPGELEDFTVYKLVVNEAARQLRLVDINYQDQPLEALPTQKPSPSPTPTLAPSPQVTPPTSAPASTSSAGATGQSGPSPVPAP